jgi:hypothetical protein
MSPVKNRRRLPTLINRGLGLLEVILPCGSSDPEESALPPGQRDTSGFWFPAGYDGPADIFTPLQRELQENQRRIQRRRMGSKRRPPPPPGAEGPLSVSEPSRASQALPAMGDSSSAEARVPAEMTMPLPAPQPESRLPQPAAPGAVAARFSPAGPPLLPATDTPQPLPAALLVDSREGSD